MTTEERIEQTEITDNKNKKNKSKKWLYFGFGGVLLGMLLCAAIMVTVMPSMMIVTKQSRLGFDETVETLKQRIVDHGWALKDVKHVNREIQNAGYDFEPRIALLKLCKAEYANQILTTDRYIACMMPCTMAVWEGDDGNVYFSEMNLSLMAKMFGGNISKIMGGKVVEEEEAMLQGIFVN
jgi:uncharacterized protein (DUF302 family)